MNIYDILRSRPIVHAIGVSLAQFLWQGIVVALVIAAVLAYLKRRSPEVRYVAACIGLLLMVLLPLATLRYVYSTSSQRVTAGVSVTLETEPGNELGETIEDPVTLGLERFHFTLILKEETIALRDRLAPWVAFFWFVGVALLSPRLVGGLYFASVLKRRYCSMIEERWQQVLNGLRRRLGIVRAVALLQSHRIIVPVMIGWIRPAVLLPVSVLSGLTPAQIETLIAHELAHIRRYDYVVNFFQNIVEMLFFYHPAVWWVSKQVRDERELCCDDVVLRVCGDPRAYAGALADMLMLRMKAPVMALAAGGGSLSKRIRRLLGLPQQHARQTSRGLTGILALAMLLALCATLAIGAVLIWEKPVVDAAGLLETAQAYMLESKSHRFAGDAHQALLDVSAAADVFEKLVGYFPSLSDYTYALARTQHLSALALWNAGQREEAVRLFTEAASHLEQLHAEFPDNEDYARQLLVIQTHRSEYTYALARSQHVSALALWEAGQRVEAVKLITQAAAHLEQLHAEFPDNEDYARQLLEVQPPRCAALIALGRDEQADDAERAVLKLLRELHPTESEYRIAVSKHDIAFGGVLHYVNEIQRAAGVFERAIEMTEQLVAESPDDPRCHELLARALAGRARLFARPYQPDPEIMQRAVHHARTAVTLEPTQALYRKELVLFSDELSWALYCQGRGNECGQMLNQTIALLERASALAPGALYDLLLGLHHWGTWCKANGYQERAEQLLWKAETVRQELVRYFPHILRERRNALSSGPTVDYKVRISTPGKYQLYVRAERHDDESDSLYAWVEELCDGPGGRVADRYYYILRAAADFGTGEWSCAAALDEHGDYTGVVWRISQPGDAVWPISEPGDYTIRFMALEDGVAIDAFAFQLSSLQAPTGDGPEESTATANGVFIESNGRAVVEAEHFTSRSVVTPSAAIYSGGNWLTVPDEDPGDVVHSNFRGASYVQALPDMTPSI